VIEQIVNNKELTQPITNESVEREKVQAFIEQVHAETSCEYLVKTKKENVHVPRYIATF